MRDRNIFSTVYMYIIHAWRASGLLIPYFNSYPVFPLRILSKDACQFSFLDWRVYQRLYPFLNIFESSNRLIMANFLFRGNRPKYAVWTIRNNMNRASNICGPVVEILIIRSVCGRFSHVLWPVVPDKLVDWHKDLALVATIDCHGCGSRYFGRVHFFMKDGIQMQNIFRLFNRRTFFLHLLTKNWIK